MTVALYLSVNNSFSLCCVLTRDRSCMFTKLDWRTTNQPCQHCTFGGVISLSCGGVTLSQFFGPFVIIFQRSAPSRTAMTRRGQHEEEYRWSVCGYRQAHPQRTEFCFCRRQFLTSLSRTEGVTPGLVTLCFDVSLMLTVSSPSLHRKELVSLCFLVSALHKVME